MEIRIVDTTYVRSLNHAIAGCVGIAKCPKFFSSTNFVGTYKLYIKANGLSHGILLSNLK